MQEEFQLCYEVGEPLPLFDWIPHALFWSSSLSSASVCAKVRQLIRLGVAFVEDICLKLKMWAI